MARPLLIEREGGNVRLFRSLAAEDHDLWPALSHAVSPNGSMVVVRPPKQLMQVVGTNGKVVRELRSGWQVQWTADSRAVSYLDEGGGAINLWLQPLDGAPRQVTHFTIGGVIQYAWSRDGRWLALTRGTQRTRVVMFEGIR